MNERLAFLHAIRANPDDDTVRLVFADWLSERADPLGEFIRVQIELEPIRFSIGNPRAVELHAREDELLRRYGDEWIGAAAHFPNPTDFGPVFRRGLPDYACLALDTFLTHGDALLTAFPTLREVALYGLANRCSELTLCPLLAKLDTLEIADWLTEDDAISLSVSPHLDRIARFKLWIGGEPYFLRELVKQAGTNWPREIELVQVWGGLGCEYQTRTPSECDADADQAVREANEQLGREAVRVTRHFQRRLPLSGRVGRYLYAGHLPDGRPALAAAGFGQWVLVVFDAAGRVAEVVWRESPVTCNDVPFDELYHRNRSGEFVYRNEAPALIALDIAAEQWVDDELKLAFGVIWVYEFEAEIFQVMWMSWQMIQEVDPVRGAFSDGWQGHGEVRGWLERRDFAIGGCGGGTADWRGKIHSN